MVDTESTVEIHACDNDSLSVVTQRQHTVEPGQQPRTLGFCMVCDRIWHRSVDGRTWYDPTEGPDPSLPGEMADDGEVAPELIEALRTATSREQQEWADRQFYGHA